ncbi:hypothetical protein AB0M02_35565 [Actinoplanes sp. NPDC051861]|uniref:hypothetical protein n=1 Tax=Actinoplanes sp. NPDC051861 TaxID=3155170 RepID=UPI00343151C7
MNVKQLEASSRAVADQATCRTVDTAIVGYLAQHGESPKSISQLKSYVKGDISRYRIVNGVASGPGC